jgi:hypothetical protein
LSDHLSPEEYQHHLVCRNFESMSRQLLAYMKGLHPVKELSHNRKGEATHIVYKGRQYVLVEVAECTPVGRKRKIRKKKRR